MTQPRLEDRPEQPYVAVHREVIDGISAAVDSAFPELFGWLGAAPAADDAVATAPVRPGVLAVGRYVTFVHVGPYRSELGAAREALTAWIAEQGIAPRAQARAGAARRAPSTAWTSGPTVSPTRHAGGPRSSC